MILNDQLSSAIELAAKVHAGQVDKQGQAYILHVMRVVLDKRLVDDVDRTCAALHDVVEDDPTMNLDMLGLYGFSPEIIGVVDLLTRQPHDRYSAYIARLMSNDRAVRVKLADLDDHLSRIDGLPPEDRTRLRSRYTWAHTVLFMYVKGHVSDHG